MMITLRHVVFTSVTLLFKVESSFSTQSTQTVVSEVLNVLTPRIMTLISDALSAQEAARQQAAAAAAAEAKRQQALLLAQQQEEARRQAAAAAAAAAEEQRRQAAAAAAAAAAQQDDSSLNSLFGDGKTHYVHIEVPGVFKEEYNLA